MHLVVFCGGVPPDCRQWMQRFRCSPFIGLVWFCADRTCAHTNDGWVGGLQVVNANTPALPLLDCPSYLTTQCTGQRGEMFDTLFTPHYLHLRMNSMGWSSFLESCPQRPPLHLRPPSPFPGSPIGRLELRAMKVMGGRRNCS